MSNDSLPPRLDMSSSNVDCIESVHTSFSTSPLASVYAVVGKKWLFHFSISRFERGSLEERFARRKQKLEELNTRHFSFVLPTLVRLSFLNLASNWALQVS